LSLEIADHLGVELGRVEHKTFPDGEIWVRILENVRGCDVFVVQSVAGSPNEYLMQLLIMIDALKRASARSISLVIPYFGYCRQDRKDKGRVPITARLVANMLECAGATRVLTMDLHADQVQGFFDIPVDNLYARPKFVEAVRDIGIEDLVVACADVGGVKLARDFADSMGAELAIVDKRRIDESNVVMGTLIGDIGGKNVLLVDDICATAETLVRAAETCKKVGARNVYGVITHGMFVADALEKIERSSIERLLVSNTIPRIDTIDSPKVGVVSVAGLFGEAIRRILTATSVLSLFN